ncbi:MAG: response regulator transcription factor [Thermodesulfobacteriota bacterium]
MSKVRCIIVDDEHHIRVFLKSVLKLADIEVAGEASNGEEGVNLFKQLAPDLVLMDINMPVKTGEEALKEIKALNPYSMVIMLTSIADSETVKKCIESGADSYLRKDTPLPELKKIFREIREEYMEE